MVPQLLVQHIKLELEFRKELQLHLSNIAPEELEVYLSGCQATKAS